MKFVFKFLANHHRALFVTGCFLLTFSCICFIAGCGVPTFLADLETIIPIAGSAISGLLAIVGGLTGNAAEVAAGAAIQVIVTKVDEEFAQINTLITNYKSSPNDTLLENIEAAVQEVTSDLAKILEIGGVPASVATAIQGVVQAVVAQLNALLTIIPVFKGATAGQSLSVIKPVPAAAFKAQINAALSPSKAA